MLNAIERYFDDFIAVMSAVWTKTITGTTPTILGITGEATGGIKLLLTNTSEAQIATLSHGDICSFKADNIKTATFRLKCTADITTAQTLVFGLTSARADDPDATASNVQFKLAASTAVVVECDDGTTDTDDAATAATLSTAYKEFVIDFTNGLSDIRFYASNAGGELERLAPRTTFSAAALTGDFLQPNIQLQKASGTTTPSVVVDYVSIDYIR